jgi:hypothetical protein
MALATGNGVLAAKLQRIKSFVTCTFGRGKDSTRPPDFRNFIAGLGLF